MDTLEQEYRDDPILLDYYKKKLLEPGWAGQLCDNDAEYISKSLSEGSPALKSAWRKVLIAAGYTGPRRRCPGPGMVKTWCLFLQNRAIPSYDQIVEDAQG